MENVRSLCKSGVSFIFCLTSGGLTHTVANDGELCPLETCRNYV